MVLKSTWDEYVENLPLLRGMTVTVASITNFIVSLYGKPVFIFVLHNVTENMTMSRFQNVAVTWKIVKMWRICCQY